MSSTEKDERVEAELCHCLSRSDQISEVSRLSSPRAALLSSQDRHRTSHTIVADPDHLNQETLSTADPDLSDG